MTEVSELRALLRLYNIDDSKYSDTDLSLILDNAKSTIGEEYITPQEREDYKRNFEGDYYMTDYYPIRSNSLSISVDGEVVVCDKITTDGIIYFNKKHMGTLSCSYIQECDTQSITTAILQLALYMIQEQNGKNMNSITEGDISITYNNNDTFGANNRIQNLIHDIRNRYKARVRLL